MGKGQYLGARRRNAELVPPLKEMVKAGANSRHLHQIIFFEEAPNMKEECWVVTHDDNLVCVCKTKEIALDNLIVLVEEFEMERKDYIIQKLTERCNVCKYYFGCRGYAAEETLYFAE